jgi:hypothetical protein
MEQTNIYKNFIEPTSEIDIVKKLLDSGWKKEASFLFYKERNTYVIKINGKNRPIWQIEINPKNDGFDENDWKLNKDIKELKRLNLKKTKHLYINDRNKRQIANLVEAMFINEYQLVFDEDYILFRDNNDIKVFKIAAAMSMVNQKDGLYIGDKRII